MVLSLQEFKDLSKKEKEELKKVAKYKKQNLKRRVQNLPGKMGERENVKNGGATESPSKVGTPVQKLQPSIEKYTELLDMAESDD